MRLVGAVVVVGLFAGANTLWAQEAPAPAPAPAVPLPPPWLPPGSPTPPAEIAAPVPPPELAWVRGLRLSGYAQPRYEANQDSDFGVDPVTRVPRGTSRFYVARARLRVKYATPNAAFSTEVGSSATGSASGVTVGVIEAEAMLLDTWTPFAFRLTAGQFRLPFGFETMQLSEDRELPERSTMIEGTATVDGMFSDIVDRGVRLQGGYRFFHLEVAVINGSGTQDPIYKAYAPQDYKDVLGRLGIETQRLDVGLSGYLGRALHTTLPTKADPVYALYQRVRLGADAQLTLRVPRLGRLTARGEIIWGNDRNLDFAGVAADGCKDFQSLGWYATLVQEVGARLGVVVRVDQYDPRRAIGAGCPDEVLSNRDLLTTVGAGILGFVSSNLKITLAYEWRLEQSYSIANNRFTAQMQARF